MLLHRTNLRSSPPTLELKPPPCPYRNKEWKSPEVRVPSVDLKLREFQAPKSRVTSPTPSQPGSRPASPLQTSMPRQKPPTGPPTEVGLRMQEAAEKNVVAPATPPKADFKRADSVPLPYNIEVCF